MNRFRFLKPIVDLTYALLPRSWRADFLVICRRRRGQQTRRPGTLGIYSATSLHSERGRIKDWTDQLVYVVYQCDDQWDRFEE